MSTQIREDESKITLIPTRENSLRMILLQHVINRKTPKSCIITEPRRNYGRGKWTQAVFLGSWAIILLDHRVIQPRGRCFYLFGLGQSRRHSLTCFCHSFTDGTEAGKGKDSDSSHTESSEHSQMPALPRQEPAQRDCLETCRTLGSVTKVLNWSSKEPEGQTGQD